MSDNSLLTLKGLKFPGRYVEELALSALEYEPSPDDLFVVTYPKCGTSWVSSILILLFRDGAPVTSLRGQLSMCPYIDMMGSKSLKAMGKPGAIRTHLPYDKAPRSQKAKYILVVRNPKDCLVSYYHHNQKRGYSDDFDAYFEKFIVGNVGFGSYFDHLDSWLEHRKNPNVLTLIFEEMKKNLEAQILRIASFVDDEQYAQPLRKHPQKLKDIVERSKIDFIKKSMDSKDGKEDFVVPKAIDEIFAQIKSHEETLKVHGTEEVGYSILVRKGISGDWRNYFNPEQNERMNDMIKYRVTDSSLLEAWKDHL